MRPLPHGWRWETLEEVAAGGLLADGDWVESKDQDPAGSVRLTQLADVGVGRFRDRSNRWMREDQAAALSCTFLQPDDVLIARMPEPIGRACLVPRGIGRAVTAVDVVILRVGRLDVDPRFLAWAINSPAVHAQIARLQSGTTRKRVSRKNLATVRIPLPPISEQQRIVEIVEDYLSRLDMAQSSLTKVGQRARLMLVSAMRAALAAIDAPERTLAATSLDAEYGTSAKCVIDGPGVAVVRIPNLKGGRIDLTDEKRLSRPDVDVSRLMLRTGDLLIIRTNGSRDLIGRSAVVRDAVPASFASYLIRYTIDRSIAEPDWVHLMLDMPDIRRQLESLAASSAGQYNLSLTKLAGVRIPMPSLGDQRPLIDYVTRLHDAGAALRAHIDQQRERSVLLRTAMLQAAFAGALSGRASDADRVEDLGSA